MTIDEILRSDALKSIMLRAIDDLDKINALENFTSLAFQRGADRFRGTSLELSAQRGVFTEGYTTCLYDIMKFFDRFGLPVVPTSVPKDFGAGNQLLQEGALDQAEYAELTGKPVN